MSQELVPVWEHMEETFFLSSSSPLSFQKCHFQSYPGNTFLAKVHYIIHGISDENVGYGAG